MHNTPNTIIGYVELKTANLEKSLNYYQMLLGFRLIQQADDKAYLSASGTFPAQIILSLMPKAIEKPYRTTGLYHLAIRLPNRKELALFLKHLLENNVSLLGLSDHQVSEAIYISDPDDNGIEVYCDRPLSKWPTSNNEVNMATKHLSPKDLFMELDINDKWNGIHPEAVIGHIHLQVSDLKACEIFYNQVLGLNITQRSYPGALFFAAENYHHHIACNTWSSNNAPPPTDDAVGLKEFSIIFQKHEELIRTIERAIEAGYLSLEESDVSTIKSIRIQDPSKIRLNLTLQPPC